MNKNTIIISTISVIVMLGFLFGAYMLTSQPEVSEYEELKVTSPTDHIKWSKEKKNILIEYADLQCPACKQYHDIILTEIEKDKEVTDKVTFVFRHFPLDNAHPNARDAAYAAEAAHKQGKFFEMSDLLFENQNTWSGESDPTELFVSYAKELKLNEDQFKKDMTSQEVKDIVQNDFLSGSKANVQGTPTFFYNGKKMQTPGTIDDFKQMLLEGAQ